MPVKLSGWPISPGDQLHDAFLWRNGRMTDLGNLGVTSHAFSINNHGQIVGNSRVDDTTIHAFLWEDGEMVDLNDLVSPHSDVVLTDFETISDNGEIIGGGLPAGCTDDLACGHAYVLIPNGDCDGRCEQRIAENQRTRTAAAQLARSQTSAPRNQNPPTEPGRARPQHDAPALPPSRISVPHCGTNDNSPFPTPERNRNHGFPPPLRLVTSLKS